MDIQATVLYLVQGFSSRHRNFDILVKKVNIQWAHLLYWLKKTK